MNGGDNGSPTTLYQGLVDRCQRLEADHQRLRKQFKSLLQERSSCSSAEIHDNDRSRSSTGNMTSYSGEKRSDSSWACVPGTYFSGNPYRNVLDCMGHAVYITPPGSPEIIYWNRAAEKLFGYKDYELIGKRFTALHIDEEHISWAKKIMERLRINGQSWSGQFPFKRKSGEMFMAMVTQTPLYEEGELVGIITVSSDATVFNNQESERAMECHDHQDDGHFKVRGLNMKKVQWGALPHIASSVSDLSSKVLLRKRGDSSRCNECYKEKDKGNEVEIPEIKSERPPRIPARRPRFEYAKSFIEKRRVEGSDDSLNA